MKLLLHFIRKDVAALRWWLLAWTLACLTHFALRMLQLAHGDNALSATFSTTARPDYLATIIFVILIVPQIVQLDSPARGDAFWKTVPLSFWRVLAGKVTIIAIAFVLFPLALEFIYFSAAGFGATTPTAVGAWLERMLPLVLIASGAAALDRDFRVTVLLTAAAVLPVFFPAIRWNSLGSIRQLSVQTISWQSPTGWWLGVMGAIMLFWQYRSRGRHGWLMLSGLLVLTFPFRTALSPSSSNAITAKPRGGGAGQASNSESSTPAKSKLLSPIPAGVDISLDSLPEFVGFSDIRDRGQLCTVAVRLAMHHLPDGVAIGATEFEDCRIVLPNSTIAPASAQNQETTHSRFQVIGPTPQTLAQLKRILPENRWTLSAPLFPLSRAEIQKGPAYLEGRLRVNLVQFRELERSPFQEGIRWNSGLHELRLRKATRTVENSECRLHFGWQLLTTSGIAQPLPISPGDGIALVLRHDVFDASNLMATVASDGSTLYLGKIFSATAYLNQNPLEEIRIDLTRERAWHTLNADFRVGQMAGTQQISSLDAERLAFELGDVNHWQLVVEEHELIGQIEIPVRVGPLVQYPVTWQGLKEADRRNAFAVEMDRLTLQNPGDAAEVAAYLDKLFLFWAAASKDLASYYRNTLQLKLAAIGSQNLEALLERADSFLAPEASRMSYIRFGGDDENLFELSRVPDSEFAQRVRAIICDLADEAHKDSILRHLSPYFDLLPAIYEHGWEKDAIPVMKRYAQIQALPGPWNDLLAASADPDCDAALMAQVKFSALSADALNRARWRAGFPQKEFADEAWMHCTRIKLSFLLRYFSLGCAMGNERVPQDLYFLLRMGINQWQQTWQNNSPSDIADAQRTLVGLFGRYSDCPSDTAEALTWLTAHYDQLRFKPETHRYELP